MRGDRRSRGTAPHQGEDAGLRVCVDVPGLNRAASQELFWPSRVGRCEGPPHSYVRMPFGLPSMTTAYQRNLRSILAAHEARHHAVLTEMETVLKESRWLMRSNPCTTHLQLPQHPFHDGTR